MGTIQRGGGGITTKARHKSLQLTRNCKRSEMKRCRPESLSLPLELQLLRGICGLGAMFLRQAFVDDTYRRPYITAAFTWILSPSFFFSFSFSSYLWGLGGGSDAHLLPQPPAHLSFKRRKPCRLLWTLHRLNSFKISFNYRPRETAETFFFELAIIAFVGSSIIRTWRYMKNLCPSRQEKHASEREKKKKQSVSFMTTAGSHRKCSGATDGSGSSKVVRFGQVCQHQAEILCTASRTSWSRPGS